MENNITFKDLGIPNGLITSIMDLENIIVNKLSDLLLRINIKESEILNKITEKEIGLYLGKIVNHRQLRGVFGTYILLTNIKLIHNKKYTYSLEGKIEAISYKPIKSDLHNSIVLYQSGIYSRSEDAPIYFDYVKIEDNT